MLKFDPQIHNIHQAKLKIIVNWDVLDIQLYGLLTKLVWARWLDIGQVLFLRVFGPRRSQDQ